jgi:hypothetical protein
MEKVQKNLGKLLFSIDIGDLEYIKSVYEKSSMKDEKNFYKILHDKFLRFKEYKKIKLELESII